MDSEDLWRAALHDFNNLLTGLQGVVDLGDPSPAPDPQHHARMETLLEDGRTLIAMARALALGRLPYSEPIPWTDWEAGLRARLDAAGALFRCPVELVDAGAGQVPWPAPLFQDWIVAFTRQVLPWAAPGPLRIEAEAESGALLVRWHTDASLPSALEAEAPADAPRSLAGHWLRDVAGRLDLTVERTETCLCVRLPDHASDSPIRPEP